MKIKFLPTGQEIENDPNKTLLQLCTENQIEIRSICKGVPSCAECRVKIVGGEHNVLPPTKAEIGVVGSNYFIDQRRLACQVHCFGEVTVDITEQIERSETQNKKVRGFRAANQKGVVETHAKQGTMVLEEPAEVKPEQKPQQRPQHNRPPQQQSRSQNQSGQGGDNGGGQHSNQNNNRGGNRNAQNNHQRQDRQANQSQGQNQRDHQSAQGKQLQGRSGQVNQNNNQRNQNPRNNNQNQGPQNNNRNGNQRNNQSNNNRGGGSDSGNGESDSQG